MNRFNGLLVFSIHSGDGLRKDLPCERHGETVETVPMILASFITGLKPGVNRSLHRAKCPPSRALLLLDQHHWISAARKIK